MIREKDGQREIQNVQFEEKRSTKKCNGASPVLKEIKFKGKLDAK